MSEENKTLDKQQNGNDFIADVMHSDLLPKVIDKQIIANERADGSFYYYAIVTMRFKIFFGLIPIKEKMYVHKVNFEQIYYLGNSSYWKHEFKDRLLAKNKLNECILSWQKEYLHKKTVKSFRV